MGSGKFRRGGLAVAVCMLLLIGKAGCSREDAARRGEPLTPARGRGYTPLPAPPTPTFIPGLPTPPPDLPG